MILIKNCKVIPELTEGVTGDRCDILTEGKRIKGIYECGAAPEEADQVIDAEGKYVLPGFFDLHVHLNLSGGDTLIDNAKSQNQQCYDALKHAQDTLRRGFTTLRDVGGYYNVPTDLRDAINAGLVEGPTLYSSGKILIPTEAGNDFFREMYEECDTIDEIKKGVRRQMALGSDFIKVLGTGAVMNPGGEPGQPIYTQEELNAIVDAAAFKDTYVSVHCHGTRAIKMCIQAGVRTIEHASMLDDEAVEMLKDNPNSFVVPTLIIIEGLSESVPASSTFMKAKAQNVLEHVRTGMRKAYEAGLLLGFGTDTGASPIAHGQNGQEFVSRRDFWGMKEIDIIKQATINSAKIIQVDDEYGTLAAGKYADIVIVDGDPLTHIEVLRDNIDTVIKWGKVVD